MPDKSSISTDYVGGKVELRICAAVMVLTVHIGQKTGFDFSVGAKGVQLFFCLSGYLAFLSLDRDPSVEIYIKKRIVRILPTYWICLLILCVEYLIMGGGECEATGQNIGKLIRYFLLLQCFTPTENWNLWNNYSALWTMSAFAGFYIAAPFLYKVMKKFYFAFSLLLILMIGTPYIAEMIQNKLSYYPPEAHIEWFASSNPLTELYCFLLGSTLYIAIKEKKQMFYILSMIGILVISRLSWYPYELLFMLLILVAVSFRPITKGNLSCKVISKFSEESFTLYLIHPILLRVGPLFWKGIGLENGKLYIAFLYLACFGVSYILYYFIISKIEKKMKFILLHYM